MSYKQRDAHFGDDNNLNLWWLPLTRSVLDQIPRATVRYEKVDSSQVDIVIIREKQETHPFGYKIRAELVPDAIVLASQGDDRLELMLVTGKELTWEKMGQEAKTLPSSRLDIVTRTCIGNSFIGATASDQIGMLLYQDSKWRVLVSVDDAGVPVFTLPVKVLCTK